MPERSRVQACRYNCFTPIYWKGKTGERGSTGWFEVDKEGNVTDIEHTYKRCEDIRGDRIIAEELEAKRQEAIEKKKAEHGGGLEAFSE